jgi:hypothetical protein
MISWCLGQNAERRRTPVAPRSGGFLRPFNFLPPLICRRTSYVGRKRLANRRMPVLPVTLLLASAISGCGSFNDSSSESQRVFIQLMRSCIEANGGARMDAVGLYGGRLSAACAQWAHHRARDPMYYPLQ